MTTRERRSKRLRRAARRAGFVRAGQNNLKHLASVIAEAARTGGYVGITGTWYLWYGVGPVRDYLVATGGV